MLAKGRSSHQRIIFKGTDGKGQKQPPDVLYETKAVIFRDIQRNTYFEEHLRTAASEREALILY